jgi:hypothetical protein
MAGKLPTLDQLASSSSCHVQAAYLFKALCMSMTLYGIFKQPKQWLCNIFYRLLSWRSVVDVLQAAFRLGYESLFRATEVEWNRRLHIICRALPPVTWDSVDTTGVSSPCQPKKTH